MFGIIQENTKKMQKTSGKNTKNSGNERTGGSHSKGTSTFVVEIDGSFANEKTIHFRQKTMPNGLNKTFLPQTAQAMTGLMRAMLCRTWMLGSTTTNISFQTSIRLRPSPGTEYDRYYVQKSISYYVHCLLSI